MPVLLWVAFWSWVMGSATCSVELPQPIRVEEGKRRANQPAV